MLHEDNIRKGFFERHEFEAVCTFLPEPYADIANFAYITGWRSAEIKDLQFRNLDFEAGEVRLEPGTTKSREGRAFPMFGIESPSGKASASCPRATKEGRPLHSRVLV